MTQTLPPTYCAGNTRLSRRSCGARDSDIPCFAANSRVLIYFMFPPVIRSRSCPRPRTIDSSTPPITYRYGCSRTNRSTSAIESIPHVCTCADELIPCCGISLFQSGVLLRRYLEGLQDTHARLQMRSAAVPLLATGDPTISCLLPYAGEYLRSFRSVSSGFR
jgi:hypothetical protein